MNDQLIEQTIGKLINEPYIIFGSGSTVNLVLDKLVDQYPNIDQLIVFSASSSTSRKLQEHQIKEGSLSFLQSIHQKYAIPSVDSLDQIVIQQPLSSCQFIKGHGGALVREKILWRYASKNIVVLDEKKISTSFSTFIPIEVIPTAIDQVAENIISWNNNFHPILRVHGRSNSPVITDNGNYLIDLHYDDPLNELKEIHSFLKSCLGVVDTGIFFSDYFKKLMLIIAYSNRIDVLI